MPDDVINPGPDQTVLFIPGIPIKSSNVPEYWNASY
jgi:hypothetical protein